jgi:phenylalanyl-tRNA synthetase beta chain
MKVSINWLKEYLDFDLPASQELVAKIAAQLGGIDEVIELGSQYQGVIVAKVVSCEKIAESDHLNVCMIDDGQYVPDAERNTDGLVQVVCGAPNVTAGITVAWLPPGSTVPASFHDAEPFVLSVRPLRGVLSNGMLASAKELSIGDNHEGLLLLDENITPGTPFADAYKLNDTIIDIENKMFTHRPDCFGQLGIAREVAGILGHAFHSPDWYMSQAAFTATPITKLPINVINELPELVPRFMIVPLSNIDIRPSPLWLQTYLSRLGLRPINNVVDITNYSMLLTGQPMHAYDYDKIVALSGDNGATIVVRQPHQNETIALLNGKTIQPRPEAILIATDEQPIGLGGVMGGADSEVDANTKNIVLEVASFDMFSIRRTSMTHGLFSDAVTRFTKGQSPLQNAAVLVNAVAMLSEHANAQLAGPAIDDNQLTGHKSLYPAVTITAEFINQRLGLTLSAETMQHLLQYVEFDVALDGQTLTVTSPFWRTDIEQREDVVEEIGRLYGYDAIPLQLPMRTIDPVQPNSLLTLKQKLRLLLASSGANEVLTYSFVHGDLLEKVGQDKHLAYKLSNALSPDLQYYRVSLLPSLLSKVHANHKAGYDQFAIFELGKVHAIGEHDSNGLPLEFERLAMVYSKQKAIANDGAAYYKAQHYVQTVLQTYNLRQAVTISPLHEFEINDHEVFKQLVAVFEPGRSAVITHNGTVIGAVGEYTTKVRKNLKLPEQCAGFELFLSSLQQANDTATYLPQPRFPKIEQDISIKASITLSYQSLRNFVVERLLATKPEHTLLRVIPLDIYQRPEDPEHLQTTFRVSMASYDRTLTDSEIATLLDDLTAALQNSLEAERI